MGSAAGSRGRAGPRDVSTRVALAIKLLVGTGALVVAAVRYGVLGAALVVLLGLGLAALTQRRKAAAVPGALWTAPADLLLRGRRFPGQLSVLSDGIIWRPSKYSVQHGVDEVRTDSSRSARVNGGPAVADVFLTLTSPDGTVSTFLTRWSPRLAKAIDEFGNEDS